MEMVYWILDPLIAFIAALRITPNMVTLFSLRPGGGRRRGARLRLVRARRRCWRRSRRFCDIVDGLLARKTGVSSDAGEVIDAAVDRYGEMFFFGGLVYYYRDARSGAVHRARGARRLLHGQLRDGEGRGDGRAAPRGAMRRGERAAYLIVGAAFTPIAKALFANSPSLALHELPIILALDHRGRGREHLGGPAAAARSTEAACARSDEGAAGRAAATSTRAARQQAGHVPVGQV